MTSMAPARLSMLSVSWRRYPRGKGKVGEKNVLALPSLYCSCVSLCTLSACLLSYGRDMVQVPHELVSEIAFKINNLEETGCSLKSRWELDSNTSEKHCQLWPFTMLTCTRACALNCLWPLQNCASADWVLGKFSCLTRHPERYGNVNSVHLQDHCPHRHGSVS